MTLPRAALLLLLLAGCARPAAESYVQATLGPRTDGQPAGTDARGAACTAQPGAAPPADLPVLRTQEAFCGGWSQAAARVVELGGPADAARLDALASGGLWRTWLDGRVACGAPQNATLAGGLPARVLSCTRRTGGWPHIAAVIAGPQGPVLADGLSTTLPVIERLASGTTGGTVAPAAGRSEGAELALRRLSAGAFEANDVGRYEQLMSLGRELNQAENFSAAEDAYRAALAVQERVLGRDNPDTVTALIHLALNLSNQGRLRDAEALFTRADTLAPRAADPVAPARLLHYRGLHALNAGEPAQAEALLRRAESAYAALVPPSALEAGTDVLLINDPSAQSALLGLAEARRGLAIAVSRAGRPAEAPVLLADSQRLLRRAGLAPGLLIGRGLRTEAAVEGLLGRGDTATERLDEAARRFNTAAPGERPEAVTLFLSGARLEAANRHEAALAAFRNGAAVLRARGIALPVATVLPYLDALAAQARARPADAPALFREMFGVVQLAQRSATVRFVQQASARLGAAGGNEAVAAAVRRLQDADQTLRDLYAQRDTSSGSGGPNARVTGTTELDNRIQEAQRLRAEAESEVAAAAPGYRQLLLSVVEADAAARTLAPGEALVTMLLGRDHGFTVALRRDGVAAARVEIGEAEATRLVNALRESAAGTEGAAPGRFNAAPSLALYKAVLEPLAATLEGADTLIVAPDGPLLAVPFGMLLTGPVDPGASLGGAPWLIRRHAIVHVPSPQTLVTLRAAGTGSSAPLPYLGFGDFVPPTAAQLTRSFPPDRCATDARLAQGLGRLPGTRTEVLIAQQTTGARPDAVKLGAAFTEAALRSPDLGRARILHLATHALLPGELSCLPEPAVVVSAPANAPSADASFVRASEMLSLHLDADLVILSACNTGGPGGGGGGEALSGLARAFFYAGARGLLASHWAVDDSAAALTVADLLRRQEGGSSTAAALRGAQLLILEEAGKRLPESFAHPFYWAPFALIGDGRRTAPQRSAGL
ncbi:CHAT domain-containing protein [Roseomonas sp. BN140053]|uniref:CHAT domain-containing protein n=1 Tax=Roseomonas sp. BN140053 TaxID=3391898 RepID=UPI0039ECFC2A